MPPSSRPDLRSYTGYLLRRAYLRSAGADASCIGDDTRVREASVLFILDELGTVSQREVAVLTHISPTVVVSLVDSLSARGWVARERNPDDRRSYALRLTAAGRSALRRLAGALERSEQQLTSPLGDAEVARLRSHLVVLLDGDPALRVTALADRVGYLVEHAHRHTRDLAQRELREVDLHPRSFGVLSAVAQDEPCSQSHLASVLGISDPAVLPALDALEERGLLTRVRNVDDRRFSDVRLTALGRQVLARARKQAAAVQAQIVQTLGQQENDDLCRLLTRVVDA